MMEMDQDAVNACVDLIGRSGGKEFEIGYLDEDVPVEEARWWAKAQYKGARVMVEDKTSPTEACEALVRKILVGGMCTGCEKTVTLTDDRGDDHCRWRRYADKWEKGCK